MSERLFKESVCNLFAHWILVCSGRIAHVQTVEHYGFCGSQKPREPGTKGYSDMIDTAQRK